MTFLTRTLSLAAIGLFLMAVGAPARAQDSRTVIPEWVFERACDEAADNAACRAEFNSDVFYHRADPQREPRDGKLFFDAPRSASCSYEHPAHPNWDFVAACFYQDSNYVTFQLRTTKTVYVENGAQVQLQTIKEHGKPDVHYFNDLAAQRFEDSGRVCFVTHGTGERFCAVWDLSDVTNIFEGPPPARQDGFCLIREADGPGQLLVYYGGCTQQKECRVGQERSCNETLSLPGGKNISLTSAEDMRFYDGASAQRTGDGCIMKKDYPLREICFSTEPFSPSAYPILGNVDRSYERSGTCSVTRNGKAAAPVACSETLPARSSTYIYEWAGGAVTVSVAEDMLQQVAGLDVDFNRSPQMWPAQGKSCAYSADGSLGFCFSAD